MSILYKFVEKYHDYFKVIHANNEELENEIYSIRHRIYCDELGYEPTTETGLECDAFDKHALHCLIKNVNTNEYIGGARIVLASNPNTNFSLPFEHTCNNILTHSKFKDVPRTKIGEISRLGVVNTYRRRKEDQGSIFSINPPEELPERVRIPYLTLGLYLGLIALAETNSLSHLFFLTDQMLATSIKKFGVELEQIGESIEHRGVRTPYLLRTDHVLDIMSDAIKPFYNLVKQDIVS